MFHIQGGSMKRSLLFFTLLCCLFSNFFTSPSYSQIRPSIIIVSEPITLAKVGSLYQYQVKAFSARSSDILRYRLAIAPQGMQIDSVKGLISWIPTSTGIFPVEIVVTNQSAEKAVQDFKIKVASFLGTITGTVKNDSGQALRWILVSLYPQAPVSRYPFPTRYSALTDSSGSYTITNIDSGTYYAYATSICNLILSPIPCPFGDYLPVWYKDSPTIEGATPIPVKDSNKIQINFVMHKRVQPVLVAVSGTVTDTLGKPIRGAMVVIAGVSKSPIVLNVGLPSTLNFSPERIDDTSFGSFVDVVGYGKSDSSGNYKISVLSGGPYIAACFAEGNLLQFYKEKNNVLEADRMTLSHDSSGVNFRLVPIPKISTKLSGVVKDSAGVGVPSRVILYSRGPLLFQRISTRSVHTDSSGNFVFEGVPNGSYVLQAVPFHDYLPAFYKANACGVMNWLKADTIIVKGSDVTGLVVCVKKASVRGAGRVAGRVTSIDGSSLSGVVVMAESQADPSTTTYTVSDAGGNYELTDLDGATYMISADKVSYYSSQSPTATIDYEQGIYSAQTNLVLTPETVTFIHELKTQIPESYALFQNYPNPFNPSTLIEFDLPKAGLTTLKVYNILGQEVRTLVNAYLPAGHYAIQFSANGEATREFPSGVYLYQLRSNEFSFTRKMVLMK